MGKFILMITLISLIAGVIAVPDYNFMDVTKLEEAEPKPADPYINAIIAQLAPEIKYRIAMQLVKPPGPSVSQIFQNMKNNIAEVKDYLSENKNGGDIFHYVEVHTYGEIRVVTLLSNFKGGFDLIDMF